MLRLASLGFLALLLAGVASAADMEKAPPDSCLGYVATQTGTARPDTLIGTRGDDVIQGGGGADRIISGAGRDVICGGTGGDFITAGSATDSVLGGAGSDHIQTRRGRNWVEGGPGSDTIVGDGGHDVFAGNGGQDALTGGAGPDRLFGGTEADDLFGGPDGDRCAGGGGLDSLSGCELPAGAVPPDPPPGPANRDPIALDDRVEANENNQFFIYVRRNDTDPDGNLLAISSIGGSPRGRVTISGGATSINYDTDSRFASLEPGETFTDRFTYRLIDFHGGSDTANVEVVIQGLE